MEVLNWFDEVFCLGLLQCHLEQKNKTKKNKTKKKKNSLRCCRRVPRNPLDKKSQPLTIFITEWGRFMYLSTPQGYLASEDEVIRQNLVRLRATATDCIFSVINNFRFLK